MAQDSINQQPPAPRAGSGGGVNTGAAVIGFLLFFIAGVGLMWGYDQRRMHAEGAAGGLEGAASWDDSESPIAISSKDPMWGKRDAPVTIVEFSDFQCPFCSRVEPTLDQVRQTYGPDKVRIVWKSNPLPFHQNAKPAAEAAQGVFAMAGNDAFWKFHDAAFKNQGSLGDDSYAKWASDAGVKPADGSAYKAGLASHKWADKVDADLSEGKAVGVQGTPSFFVNGVFINGAQPFDAFKKTIDQELDKAQAKIASGTPKSRLYVEASKENKKNQPAPQSDEEKEDTTVYRVPVGSSPVLGSPQALVTIVEFSDFQCPFCSRVEPTLKALRDKYGDKIRLVWKNEPLPFHPAAEPAAEAALEVRAEKGDKGFWDVHDKFFANQKDLTNGSAANIEGIVGIASQTGASTEKIKKAISEHTHKKDIDADQGTGEDFQANGTPHFFVNGRRLVGAQPEDKFEKLIDDQIKAAQDALAKGVRPSEVYEALTKEGKGPAEPEKKELPKDLPANDPARGNLGAHVTIHEWSDFQCPFCGRVEPTVAQVMKEYGDRVKFVWHDMPLPMHADAPLAAQAAREAFAEKGPSAFWALHDKMFANQQKIKRDDLDGYAQELNLNMDKWKSALDDSTHTAAIEADKKAGNEDGINGTPAFLIVTGSSTSGYFINGAQPLNAFRRAIERALSDAK